MKKFMIVMMMCVFVFGVTACEAKEKPKAPEQQQEVKKEEVKPVETQVEQPKTSPLPQKQKVPEVRNSLVIFPSSTDGVFVVKVYANDKEAITDALTYEQLVVQIPKTLETLFKKKEGK